jgi:type IV secretory pathway VirB3-like protein
MREQTLFLALTRPALKWGVPVEAFWANFIGMFYAGAIFEAPVWWRQPFVFWLLGIPIHLILRELTAHDWHWARGLRLRLETSLLWYLTSAPQRLGRRASREIASCV